MADDELHLIGPDEIAYRLDLTPAQLKITHTALKSFLDDFGHDERDVHDIVREVLGKLPDEHAIRSIDITQGSVAGCRRLHARTSREPRSRDASCFAPGAPVRARPRRCWRAHGAGRPDARRAMNVVVVVMDSLRADHIYGSHARTASWDKVGRQGLRFLNAYPEGMPTIPARRSIMAGQAHLPVPRLAPVSRSAAPAGLGAGGQRRRDVDRHAPKGTAGPPAT